MAGVALQPSLASPVGSSRRVSGLTINTNLAMSSFPEYVDLFASSDETMMDSPTTITPTNRLVQKLKDEKELARHPSPQPTHVSYPPLMAKTNGNGHRVLRSATVGYVAPEFKGKKEQMKQGQHS
jgi:glutamate dehydrogenase